MAKAKQLKRIDAMCVVCGQLATYARPLGKWIHISVGGETLEHDYPVTVGAVARLRVRLDARRRRKLLRQFAGERGSVRVTFAPVPAAGFVLCVGFWVLVGIKIANAAGGGS